MRYWYLGAPYAHEREAIRADRAEAASRVASYLALSGLPVYSPLTVGHVIKGYMGPELYDDNSFWLDLDAAFMQKALGLILCKIPGWETSDGLKRETKWFKIEKRPVMEIDPRPLIPTKLWSRLSAGISNPQAT